MLRLMYITNEPDVALIAENAGVDRIFIDMEYIGKQARQGGMDTVQSHHTPKDIAAVRSVLTRAEVLVRINPIHAATDAYPSSREEIDAAIATGADILMLPYFKSAAEVAEFVRLVDGRARTMPLVETPEAAEHIDEILSVDGIDEIFVGLNDLSLGYGMKFMFELLADGTVERLCERFAARGIPYGFGGIAALGKGALPAERVIAEHYRLGSTAAILSRSFCNTSLVTDRAEIRATFDGGLRAIRTFEEECEGGRIDLAENRREVLCAVAGILEKIG